MAISRTDHALARMLAAPDSSPKIGFEDARDSIVVDPRQEAVLGDAGAVDKNMDIRLFQVG